MNSNPTRFRKVFVGLALTLIMAAVFNYGFSSAGALPASSPLSGNIKATGAAPSLKNDFVTIARNESPAVVNISTKTKRKKTSPAEEEAMRQFYGQLFPGMPMQPRNQVRQSLGSGFVVESSGYILTNNHVVEQADEIVVTFGDGSGGPGTKEYNARIIGSDPKTDIALIKIDARKALPTIPLGDSSKLEVGEWVMAIGNPFGFSGSVTVGVVSAKGRMLHAGPYDNFIQTDASINPGNSGGPLLNVAGEVIGINSAIYTGGQSQGNIGIGFAIPINEVKNIYDDLKKGRVKRGWLGVMIQPITPDIQQALGLESIAGALVGDVLPNTPALKAGLQPGDVIITFDGIPVPSSERLPKMVGAHKPGDRVMITIVRNGAKKKLKLKLGEIPKKEVTEPKTEKTTDNLGMKLGVITPNMAKEMNLSHPKGLMVMNVRGDSPAAAANIRRGDILLSVDRKPVDSISQFEKITAAAKPGDILLLLLKRGSTTVFAAIKIPASAQ